MGLDVGQSVAWLILVLGWIALSDGKQCKKDPDLGDYPVNVYYCNDPEKPQCCQQDNQFTCCEAANEKSMMTQLQLWGSIGGIIVICFLVWLCWRRDSYMCEGDPLKDRCSTCCSECGRKRRPSHEQIVTLDNLDQLHLTHDTGESASSTNHEDGQPTSSRASVCDSGRGSVNSGDLQDEQFRRM